MDEVPDQKVFVRAKALVRGCPRPAKQGSVSSCPEVFRIGLPHPSDVPHHVVRSHAQLFQFFDLGPQDVVQGVAGVGESLPPPAGRRGLRRGRGTGVRSCEHRQQREDQQ